jgi:predicted DCC family thiol-disulfide oxidoreductase YuxK
MKTLHVLYDERCPLCARCRAWLEKQPTFVPLIFMPFRTPEVERRFPGVAKLNPEREIVVVSDDGDAWQGAHAWVMCLWALREYREWALRLAHPAMQRWPGETEPGGSLA